MFSTYHKDERTDKERYLEDELQREREQRHDEEEREQRAREVRAKEQREEREYTVRHPDSWPEAFQNQASLCWHEHNMFPEQNEEPDGDYFKVTAEANEAALKIWREVYAEKQKLIAEIQNSVRAEVADKLEAVSARNEYKFVASAIRDDSLDGYCDW